MRVLCYWQGITTLARHEPARGSADLRSAVARASGLPAQDKFRGANASRSADQRSALQQTGGLRYKVSRDENSRFGGVLLALFALSGIATWQEISYYFEALNEVHRLKTEASEPVDANIKCNRKSNLW